MPAQPDNRPRPPRHFTVIDIARQAAVNVGSWCEGLTSGVPASKSYPLGARTKIIPGEKQAFAALGGSWCTVCCTKLQEVKIARLEIALLRACVFRSVDRQHRGTFRLTHALAAIFQWTGLEGARMDEHWSVDEGCHAGSRGSVSRATMAPQRVSASTAGLDLTYSENSRVQGVPSSAHGLTLDRNAAEAGPNECLPYSCGL